MPGTSLRGHLGRADHTRITLLRHRLLHHLRGGLITLRRGLVRLRHRLGLRGRLICLWSRLILRLRRRLIALRRHLILLHARLHRRLLTVTGRWPLRLRIAYAGLRHLRIRRLRPVRWRSGCHWLRAWV